MEGARTQATDRDRLLSVLSTYWGYDDFLPLQEEAMECALAGRDSVVVLPTGGGKSLCFQAPALCRDGTAIVVSPLISLMKDQVDTLRACGIAADFVNSSQTPNERWAVARRVQSAETKILYLSPERLATESTRRFLRQLPISLFAIDEAHCISAWGHDFRPEYRKLSNLRNEFPGIGIHAFTATATERVRNDIAEQLRLENHNSIIGSFDRPNLFYRVQRRTSRIEQVVDVIQRHPNESGIVYAITRSDVESLCNQLKKRGFAAAAYHGGLDDAQRRSAQDDFINDRVQVIVATIAFGMGIDKPNVRFVIHAGMPKSLENYQQEAGRAGRDGLDAECCLLFSGHDFHVWKSLIESNDDDPGALDALSAMFQFCTSVICRHRALVEHFGQRLNVALCEACDVCRDELVLADDPLITGQKIVSCVARLQQRYGGDYTSLVLTGSKDQRIGERGHDELSTYGLLSEHDRRTVRDWIEQLVDEEFLVKVGEYNVLEITARGRELLRGNDTPRLLMPAPRRAGKTSRREDPAHTWEGVDRGLFDALRNLRKQIAVEINQPAYIVFGDKTLRDMARRRPSTEAGLLQVRGVGAQKLAEYGEPFLSEINRYSQQSGLSQDVE